MSYREIVWRGLAKAITFTGRDSRRQYWLFTLACILYILAWSYAIEVLPNPNLFFYGYLISLIWVLVGQIASGVRRLHDINRSGMWVLLVFVPLGVLVFWALCAVRGSDGDNEYGHAEPMPMPARAA